MTSGDTLKEVDMGGSEEKVAQWAKGSLSLRMGSGNLDLESWLGYCGICTILES
jgi:hypothetical protein